VSKLTPKQQAFCEEYIVDLNATQAAIRAGYSKNGAHVTASKLLSVPKVAQLIANLTQKRSRSTGIDAKWVLTEAEDLYKACRADDNHSAANNVLTTIAKHVNVQAFEERSVVRHEGELAVNTNQLSDEVFGALMEKARLERTAKEIH
jgi:phage terminase small subunit